MRRRQCNYLFYVKEINNIQIRYSVRFWGALMRVSTRIPTCDILFEKQEGSLVYATSFWLHLENFMTH
jgi:hypothetical protein